jgi:hypothetical protein
MRESIKNSKLGLFFDKKIAPTFLILLLLVLCAQVTTKIDAMPISGDGYDNFNLTYHLAFYDVMSVGDKDKNGQFIPSNIREPLPILLSAIWIKTLPSLASAKSFDDLLHGKRLITLKLQNTIYIALLLVGTFTLAYEVFKPALSYRLNVLQALVTTLITFYCIHLIYVTTLLTEFQGAFLITWFVWAWLKAWRSQSVVQYALAGFLLGCLILTKAAFLYIGIVSVGFLLIYLTLFLKEFNFGLKQLILLTVAILTILPWYVRNYFQIGVWELTQRGPVVLMTRAFKNNLNDDEFKGGFYAYAPLSLKKIMQNITGFSAADRLDGGRLQRLTRFPSGDNEKRANGDVDGAISYYIKATTHFSNIQKKFRQQEPNPIKARVLADRAAQQEAIAMIKSNPWGHLKSTLVFAWRGAWPCNTVDGRWSAGAKLTRQPIWQEILPFLGLVAMFILFFKSLLTKNIPLVITTLIGVSTFVFYSLATHFIPRYSEMFIPIWVLCFSVFLVQIFSKIKYGMLFRSRTKANFP